MSKAAFTPESDAQFSAFWHEGQMTIEDLADRFGISKATVYDWRVRLGLPARLVQASHPERDRICELWKRGLSSGEIAQIMGKSRGAVMGVVYRAGLTDQSRTSATRSIRTVHGIRTLPPPFTPEQDAQLRAMAGEGISRSNAARRLGMSDSRVRDRIKALALVWTIPKSSADSPWQKKAKVSDVERQAATKAGLAILAAATDEPGPEAVRMLERRTFGQCAWPVGEATGADQLCCGKPIPDGASGVRQSYCAGHGMRAVSRTFVRAPIVHQDRSVAAAPRHTPSNDDHLWDVAA
jgi:hypothetical protein